MTRAALFKRKQGLQERKKFSGAKLTGGKGKDKKRKDR